MGANAQINKGTILIGGQVNFFNQTQKAEQNENDHQNWNLSVSAGKAIKNNRIVGIAIGNSGMRSKGTNSSGDEITSKNDGFNIGGFYQAYQGLGKKFYAFGQANLRYQYNKEGYEITSNGKKWEASTHGVLVGATAGLSYQIFKKALVELTLPYLASIGVSGKTSEETGRPETQIKETNWGISSSLSNLSTIGNLSLGFRILL